MTTTTPDVAAKLPVVMKQKVVPDNIRSMLAGVASGWGKVAAGHPFDTVKVRLQVDGNASFGGPLDCLTQTLRQEGLRGLYKGATPPLIGLGFVDMVMVSSYNWFKRQLGDESNGPLEWWQYGLAGLGAGVICSLVVSPVEQVQMRLQLQYRGSTTTKYRGPLDCARQLYRNNGIKGFYNGYSGTLAFRSLMSLYFGSFEAFKIAFGRGGMASLPGPLRNFLAGGAAATAFWSMAFPVDAIKNRLVTQPDKKEDRKYKGFLDCVKKIYAKDGWSGFYRGFVPSILRSFPANGTAFLGIHMVLDKLP